MEAFYCDPANPSSAHLNDALLESLALRKITNRRLPEAPPSDSDFYGVTEDAILRHCFASDWDETRKLKLRMGCVRLSPEFFEKFVEV